jgi:CRP/FNR family transcriptional regulator
VITTQRSLLNTIPYFAILDEEVLESIAQQMKQKVFSEGEVIFLEGEESIGLWIIESGRVKISRHNLEGDEHVLRIQGDKGTFNDIAVFDGGLTPATATALTTTVLWILPTAVFWNIVERNPLLAQHIIQHTAKRVRTLVNRIETLTLYSVIVRLARFLLQQEKDPILSSPDITRVTIAAHINTTPQTLSTALRSLADAEAILFDRQQVTIIREDILRAIANL